MRWVVKHKTYNMYVGKSLCRYDYEDHSSLFIFDSEQEAKDVLERKLKVHPHWRGFIAVEEFEPEAKPAARIAEEGSAS